MSAISFAKRNPLIWAALSVPRSLRRDYLKWRRRPASEALDRLGQILDGGDLLLRVDEFEGRFSLSPKSDLFRRVVLEGGYEPQLAATFREHVDPARDIVDVGANVGFFSCLGARLTRKRVVAVEPTSGAADRLRKNIRENQLNEKVIVYQGLLLAEAGTGTLNVIDGREEYSSVGPLIHPSAVGGNAFAESVAALTLDELVSHYGIEPGFIKIDVEGAEGLVLSGGERTLKAFRPTILSELSDPLLRRLGTSARQVVEQLEALNYRVSDPFDPHAKPGTKEFGDILAIPRERHT